MNYLHTPHEFAAKGQGKGTCCIKKVTFDVVCSKPFLSMLEVSIGLRMLPLQALQPAGAAPAAVTGAAPAPGAVPPVLLPQQVFWKAPTTASTHGGPTQAMPQS